MKALKEILRRAGGKFGRRRQGAVRTWKLAAGVVALLVMASRPASGAPADSTHAPLVQIVQQIQKADYEGDRAALSRLYGELTRFLADEEKSSRVRYWRGFALWRRALNGFNETVEPKEQRHDLEQAAKEFEAAAALDPKFADAKAAAASCFGFLFAYYQNDPEKVQELRARAGPLRKEAGELAPDNPRYLWVMGNIFWYIPPDHGGGQDKSIEAYEKGLASARKLRGTVTDPLEPSWGEAENLMGLALANLNKTAPDLNAAEQDALAALNIAPNWHYVRDILLTQIRTAKAKQPKGEKP
jgi:tetratricopeptide (TPR) repeat protein